MKKITSLFAALLMAGLVRECCAFVCETGDCRSEKELRCERQYDIARKDIDNWFAQSQSVQLSEHSRIDALQAIEDHAYLRNECGDDSVSYVIETLRGFIQKPEEQNPEIRERLRREAAGNLLDIVSGYRKREGFASHYYSVPSHAIHGLVLCLFGPPDGAGLESSAVSVDTLNYILDRLWAIHVKETMKELKSEAYSAYVLVKTREQMQRGIQNAFQLGKSYEVYERHWAEFEKRQESPVLPF